MNTQDAHQEVSRLREAIDRVDDVIQRLLDQREKYAFELGEIEALAGEE